MPVAPARDVGSRRSSWSRRSQRGSAEVGVREGVDAELDAVATDPPDELRMARRPWCRRRRTSRAHASGAARPATFGVQRGSGPSSKVSAIRLPTLRSRDDSRSPFHARSAPSDASGPPAAVHRRRAPARRPSRQTLRSEQNCQHEQQHAENDPAGSCPPRAPGHGLRLLQRRGRWRWCLGLLLLARKAQAAAPSGSWPRRWPRSAGGGGVTVFLIWPRGAVAPVRAQPRVRVAGFTGVCAAGGGVVTRTGGRETGLAATGRVPVPRCGCDRTVRVAEETAIRRLSFGTDFRSDREPCSSGSSPRSRSRRRSHRSASSRPTRRAGCRSRASRRRAPRPRGRRRKRLQIRRGGVGARDARPRRRRSRAQTWRGSFSFDDCHQDCSA